jgi:hypothetical protein
MESITNDLLSSQSRQIFELEQLKESFMLRLHLINNNKANKSEFEKNEDDILRYETNQKIHILSNKIKAKKEEICSLYLLLESQSK